MFNSLLKKILPGEISYLAFEGGGGKGVTFLGAIQELEKESVLPIKAGPEKNQIKGISGSSAGGITALFLAMGYTSSDLEKLIDSNPFLSFWDSNPRPAYRKAIVDNNSIRFIKDNSKGAKTMDTIPSMQDFSSLLSEPIQDILEVFIKKIDNPMKQKIARNPIDFIYNLIFDGGLFSGYGVTRFFVDKIEKWANDRYGKVVYNDITFRLLEYITGVKLVITGTNISKQKPFYFSSAFTPDFPVGEAVAISMSLPLFFKPVYVDSNVNKNEPLLREIYRGLWVDGGFLNNLPIHAFDWEGRDPIVPGEPVPELVELNPGTLGLRLTEGDGTNASYKRYPDVFPSFPDNFIQLFGTTLYPSEGGQIRTYDEEIRTIDLYTFDLDTTDFAPSKKKRDKAIKEARDKVRIYFKEARKERKNH